jgi:ribose 5-phosphate isomerase B
MKIKYKIAITSDHAGYDLKEMLKKTLKNYTAEIIDLGPNSSEFSVDYSDYGNILAENILSGKADFGVAICGSGIGISIALNRHNKVRAAVCHNGLVAALARKHNDANVLCLGARLIGLEVAIDCVNNFFTTEFEGGRHIKRVEKLK